MQADYTEAFIKYTRILRVGTIYILSVYRVHKLYIGCTINTVYTSIYLETTGYTQYARFTQG